MAAAEKHYKNRARPRPMRIILFVLGLVLLSIAIVVPVAIYLRSILVKFPGWSSNRPPPFKVDCHPESGANIATCQARGCEWATREVPEEPDCIFTDGQGYRIQGKPQIHDRGFTFTLTRKSNKTLFPNDIETVQLEVRYISRTIVRLKFTDPHQNRYEVPEDPPIQIESEIFNQTYDVVWEDDPQFGIIVRRKPIDYFNNEPYDMVLVFDTRNPGFVFSSQFIQLPVRLPSSKVYGLGVQRHKSGSQSLDLSLQWKKWILWSRDAQGTSEPSFGSHPFLMSLENDGRTSGIFLRNSNAIELVLQPVPSVVFRTLGGVLDFFVFLGPTPENVVKQLTQIVGRPTLPPYWSLGFHLGRQTMANDSNLMDMLNRMDYNNIPFDSVHLGDDGLDRSISFSFNNIRFISFKVQLKEHLRRYARRAFISSWAGVSTRPPTQNQPYPALSEGNIQQLFIRQGMQNCIGKVNFQDVFYPDYSHSKASDYWAKIVAEYRKEFNLETLHILLDKNTPTSTTNGCGGQCLKNKWNIPPYVPEGLKGSLYQNTLCPDAQQVAGLHYDVHNLYSVHQARSAFNGWKKAFSRERPFILSRSHAPGIGRYAGHYISDTYSNWPDLQQSIIDILQLNLVGIPMVGSDICGYKGNATDELCLRWTQLGAFYPFSRSYNYGDAVDQYPAALGPIAMAKSREALEMRYTLLPYLYTLFHLASVDGGTVVRPLFHEFSTDNMTNRITDQFLWGPALLINPVVKPSGQQGGAYLPDARWFYVNEQNGYKQGAEVKYEFGQRLLPRNDLVLLLRGGHIIPMHSRANFTTYNSYPLRLVVALDEQLEAEGWLYLDDKETPVESQHFSRGTRLRFQMKNSELTLQHTTSGYNDGGKIYISNVQFWGVPKKPLQVSINSNPTITYNYKQFEKVVEVTGLRFRIIDRWNSIHLRFPDDGPFDDWQLQHQQQQQQQT